MVFGESFETASKEEALSEVISELQLQEKTILDTIDEATKAQATNEHTEIASLNYKFLQNNPDILDLMDTYWLKLDSGKKTLSFEVNMPIHEFETITWYNNYDISLNKKWASIVGWKLEIPWTFNDEEYNTAQKIDKMVDTMHNRILQEEQSNNNLVTEETKENLENKMNAVKKVCKVLFK